MPRLAPEHTRQTATPDDPACRSQSGGRDDCPQSHRASGPRATRGTEPRSFGQGLRGHRDPSPAYRGRISSGCGAWRSDFNPHMSSGNGPVTGRELAVRNSRSPSPNIRLATVGAGGQIRRSSGASDRKRAECPTLPSPCKSNPVMGCSTIANLCLLGAGQGIALIA